MSSAREINDVLNILLHNKFLDDNSIINLSMTTKSTREAIFYFIKEHMLTCGILSSQLLTAIFLIPHIQLGEKYDENILKLVLTYMGFLTEKASFDIEIIDNLLDAVIASKYDNPAHFRSVCANICFFGNGDVLSLFINKGIKYHPSSDHVRSSTLNAIERGRLSSANRFFKTYTVMAIDKV